MKTTTGGKEQQQQQKPQKKQYHLTSRSFVLCLLWFVTTLYVSAYVGARGLRANFPLDRLLQEQDEALTAKTTLSLQSSSLHRSSHANDRDNDANDHVSSVGMDSCFVAGRGETTYRFPTKTLTQENIPDSPEAPAVVVGVLSVASRPRERQTIRSTWAYNRTNVFFLVAGNFTTQLQQELHQHNDIIHVEAPETYRDVTTKVMVLFSAVAKYIPKAMVIKTDTDTYSLEVLMNNQVGVHVDGLKVLDLVKGVNNLTDIIVTEIPYEGKWNRTANGELAAVQCYVIDEPIGVESNYGVRPTVLRLSEYGFISTAQTIVVSDDTLANKSELVTRVLGAIFQGWLDTLANKSTAAQVVVDQLRTRGVRVQRRHLSDGDTRVVGVVRVGGGP